MLSSDLKKIIIGAIISGILNGIILYGVFMEPQSISVSRLWINDEIFREECLAIE